MSKFTRELDQAFQHHMKGEPEEARTACMNVLKKNPKNPDAYHLLGIIAYQSRRYGSAIEHITKAIALDKSNPAFLCNLGLAYAGMKEYDKAVAQYRKALKIHPSYPEAYNNLGNACKELGRPREAEEAYQRALSLNAGSAETLYNLGTVFQETGREGEAMDCYRKALALIPDSPEIHNNLAVLYKDMNDYDNAVASGTRALELDPGFIDAYLNLGLIYKNIGLVEESIRYYDRALDLSPGSIEALWGKCFARIPILYESAEEIQKSRNSYRDSLNQLDSAIETDSPQDMETASRQIGATQPFFLPYQGRSDKVLQSAYGDLLCRIQEARYPEYSEAPLRRNASSRERIRVGIVSGYFYYHSNWKIPIKGWVENMDKSEFALFGYYTGRVKDNETASARMAFERFVETAYSFEALCDTIRNDALDILIYPEIGMDPMTVRLASLRLAPVQCTSWGHPNTSGLPTMDYYLSSALMEPEDGDNHYSEELVRLPNLSVHYTPMHRDVSSMNRGDFGLSPDSIVYFCAQSLFKYLPQDDDIFPRIAREIDNCRFVFLEYKRSKELTGRFLSRIDKAFRKYSMDSEKYVLMLPQLDQIRYHAMNSLSDVFLDSIGWSGCNTTLEAIECDLPVVTLPGALMRGRHSYAILKMMGLTETITGTLDEYVDCAVRLGKDQGLREAMRAKIRQSKDRLYYDMESVKGLEAFVKDAVKGELP